MFCELTRHFDCRKIVFYNSSNLRAPGCQLQRFETTVRTNWHYQCANQFIDGLIEVCDLAIAPSPVRRWWTGLLKR